MVPVEVHSPNLGFLAPRAAALHRLAVQAERYCLEDPPTALVKLRAFAELLCERLGVHFGADFTPEADLIDMIRVLQGKDVLEFRQREMLHALRRAGNEAAHDNLGDTRLAMQNLKYARALAMWYHQVFLGGPPPGGYGPFRVPPDPRNAESDLKEDLERVRRQALSLETELKERRAEEYELRRQVDDYRRENDKLFSDFLAALDLAAESEDLLTTQDRGVAQGESAGPGLEALREKALAAAESLELDEGDTRTLVDAQLRAAGWEADHRHLAYSRGARPALGSNRAISDWPVPGENGGPLQTADYVLFHGLTPVGIVEAHSLREDVRAFLFQARRCSRNFDLSRDGLAAGKGAPWGGYRIPFLYSTDGRACDRQVPHQAGIWFCDARLPGLPESLLQAFPTPEDLLLRE